MAIIITVVSEFDLKEAVMLISFDKSLLVVSTLGINKLDNRTAGHAIQTIIRMSKRLACDPAEEALEYAGAAKNIDVAADVEA